MNEASEKHLFDRTLELGSALANASEMGGDPYIVIPGTFKVENLSRFLGKPNRIVASPVFKDVPSFVNYVSRFKTETTLIMASFTDANGTVKAILDYHGPGAPSHATHEASLRLLESDSYRRWSTANGQWTDQQRFAEFIQDNSAAIVEPDGIAVLEMVETLRVNTKVEFLSQAILKNGQVALQYAEKVEATAGAQGKLTFPELITVAIGPFALGQTYKVHVRLRFRIQERTLKIRYDIVDKDVLLETAALGVITQVKELTGFTVLRGSMDR